MVIFKKCPKAIKVSFVKCFLKSNNTPPFTLKLHTPIKNEKKNSMLNFRVQLFLQLTPASFFVIFTPLDSPCLNLKKKIYSRHSFGYKLLCLKKYS